jgi:hypothetical protein
MQEKKFIAGEIEKLLLSLKHPEMPDSKPEFFLKVTGKEWWSWADIEPNHHFDKKEPDVNPWNETARNIL